jgi:hypothetical protein
MPVLIESALRVTLLAVAVGVVLAALRIRPARIAHAAWSGVAVLMLLMPVLVAWGPEAALPVLPAAERVRSPTRPPSAVVNDSRGVMTASPQRASDTPGQGWERAGLLAYTTVALVLLLRIGVGLRHASRLRREATVLAGRLTHPRCSTPITVGLWRPAIVLPRDWTDWPPSELAAVIAHETEHVRWRDPLIGCVTLTARAMFWFHPLAWWMHRRVATLAEHACDGAVLAQGHDPQAYAALLVKFAHSLRMAGGRVALRGTMMPGNGLGSRLEMLQQPQRLLTTRPRLVAAAVAYAAAVVLASAATPIDAAAPLRDAAAAVPVAQGQTAWRAASSEHFDIYFAPAQAGRVSDLAYEAERAYAHLSADMKYDLSDRVSVVLVDRDRDIGGGWIGAADFRRGVDGRPPMSVIVVSSESLDSQPGIMLHELTHSFALQIVPEATRDAPWLIEGLADHQRGVWAAESVRRVRDAIGSAWIPRIEAIGNTERYWSHALFDFMADTYGREGIRRCLFVLRARSRLTEAIPVAFGTSMDEFDRAFRAYLTARFGER